MRAISQIVDALPLDYSGSLIQIQYAHEYVSPITGDTYRYANKDLNDAQRDIADLRTNRKIEGKLIWREVSVSVTEWRE